MKTAELFVLAGPTAVGKGTVVALLQKKYPGKFFTSVSATTRRPRPGEEHGKHYLFISQAEFERMIAAGELLEYAKVHGQNYYGTPKQPVLQSLQRGIPALLEIDLAGARQVRQNFPAARLVFLSPPSFEELKTRLVGRGTEDEAEQQRRLETARTELAAQSEFDVVVVNDVLEDTVEQLAQIMGLK